MQNIKRFTTVVSLLLLVLVTGCSKPEGQGGDASIRGAVWVEDWDTNFNLLLYQYLGVDEYVYIIYGDDVSYGDRVKTNYLGQYEFKYLRKGHYKIYVFSDKKQTVASPSKQEAIIAEVEIGSRKQTFEVDTLTIKK